MLVEEGGILGRGGRTGFSGAAVVCANALALKRRVIARRDRVYILLDLYGESRRRVGD